MHGVMLDAGVIGSNPTGWIRTGAGHV